MTVYEATSKTVHSRVIGDHNVSSGGPDVRGVVRGFPKGDVQAMVVKQSVVFWCKKGKGVKSIGGRKYSFHA